MLWWICAMSSCICGSEGEEERRVFLSIMSRLAISVWKILVTPGGRTMHPGRIIMEVNVV